MGRGKSFWILEKAIVTEIKTPLKLPKREKTAFCDINIASVAVSGKIGIED